MIELGSQGGRQPLPEARVVLLELGYLGDDGRTVHPEELGEVRQSIGFWPSAAVSISPRIPGPEAVVPK